MAGSAKSLGSSYDTFWEQTAPFLPTDENFITVMKDFESFCYHHIIIDKEGTPHRMKLNEAQIELARVILENALAEIPAPTRICILKSRQMGISTVLIMVEKYIASRKRNTNMLHIFPVEKLARNFYTEKVEPLWSGSHPSILPDMYATNSPTPYLRVKDFHGIDMNCTISYVGGNSKSLGRSGTVQVVIGDEYAFQDNVKRIEHGVLASQPKTGLALTVFVSTANGMNYFYDIYQQALKPETSIIPLFLPWHMLREYEREPDETSRYYDLNTWMPSSYDIKLIEEFRRRGYPQSSWIKKLAWYEHTLLNEAKGDVDHMNSEYPSFDDEPFRTTGSPVFPMHVVQYWLSKPQPKFDYVDLSATKKKKRYPEIEVVPTSGIRRYQEPRYGRKYLLAVDTATGVVNGDYSAGVIIDEKSREEVLSFNLEIEQTDLALLVASLANYYNKAKVIPERNMGELFIDTLTNTLGYYNVYVDVKASTRSKVTYGIRTTRPSKREAVRRMRYLMNNNLYKPKDRIFIEQCLHYVNKELPSGDFKYEAAGTDENGNPYHDDTIAARLTLMLALDFNRIQKENKEKKSNV